MQQITLASFYSPFAEEWVSYIQSLQNHICQTIERTDGKATFITDTWQRKGGGGGTTCVINNGCVFEKGGVNTSVVGGAVTDTMRAHLHINGAYWFASGISLVIHPVNPFVPTVHANFRYFELYDTGGQITDRWFGGGADLTPFYLFEEDAVYFHRTFREALAPFGNDLYPGFKKWCDEYFVNTHRDREARGIGGIFYDHLKPDEKHSLEDLYRLSKSCGDAFVSAYIPIVQKRQDRAYTPENKYWQEIRRGRYVEFNLIHDRGTVFGLKTAGRTESVLMSLPPTVRFDYDDHPKVGSEEWKLLEVLQKPRNWTEE